jgi:beta-glucosidase
MQRKKDLAVWDVVKQMWRVPKGRYTIRVGSSSRRLPLQMILDVDAGI